MIAHYDVMRFFAAHPTALVPATNAHELFDRAQLDTLVSKGIIQSVLIEKPMDGRFEGYDIGLYYYDGGKI